jgi:hypothetical protein
MSPFLNANVGGLLTLRVVRGFICHYKTAWWEIYPSWKQFRTSFRCGIVFHFKIGYAPRTNLY